MAGGGFGAGLALAAFHEHDGLFSAHAAGTLKKSATVLDTLNVQHDRPGEGILFQGFQQILDGGHGLVAGTAKTTDADTLLLGKGQKLGAHVAGLGYQRG